MADSLGLLQQLSVEGAQTAKDPVDGGIQARVVGVSSCLPEI
jgi:hypothetical protein